MWQEGKKKKKAGMSALETGVSFCAPGEGAAPSGGRGPFMM